MPVEIERKYLLRAVPELPASAQRRVIVQGYVQARHVPADERAGLGEHIHETRVRRTQHDDGRLVYTKTVKRGFGMVREEHEEELSAEQFEQLWPWTKGMRLSKTRWRWRIGEAVWAVDVFDDLDLVLAEVEVPREDYTIEIPPAVQRCIERDVTEERAYVNSEIARRLSTDG